MLFLYYLYNKCKEILTKHTEEMKVFKTKQEIANYLWVSRPAIETKLKRNEVKKIEIWKVKGYVYVREFIIDLLK